MDEVFESASVVVDDFFSDLYLYFVDLLGLVLFVLLFLDLELEVLVLFEQLELF